eukprot:gene3994-4964_t
MSNTAPSADEYKVIKTLGKIRDEEARETLNRRDSTFLIVKSSFYSMLAKISVAEYLAFYVASSDKLQWPAACRAAKQVQPLMRRRQWKVGVLLEFYPKSDCLLGLNVNHGQQVKVRLRPPGNESDFYPYEHILGTLLHELTHIKVSPHNAAFYKLLDEITQVMAEAASKRSQQNALMPSGGKRLGGNTSATSHLTPAQHGRLSVGKGMTFGVETKGKKRRPLKKRRLVTPEETLPCSKKTHATSAAKEGSCILKMLDPTRSMLTLREK